MKSSLKFSFKILATLTLLSLVSACTETREQPTAKPSPAKTDPAPKPKPRPEPRPNPPNPNPIPPNPNPPNPPNPPMPDPTPAILIAEEPIPANQPAGVDDRNKKKPDGKIQKKLALTKIEPIEPIIKKKPNPINLGIFSKIKTTPPPAPTKNHRIALPEGPGSVFDRNPKDFKKSVCTEDSLLDSFIEIEPETIELDFAKELEDFIKIDKEVRADVLASHKVIDSEVQFEIHPELLAIYPDLLKMNDWSYAIAKLTEKKRTNVNNLIKREQELNSTLSDLGWNRSVSIIGQTGDLSHPDTKENPAYDDAAAGIFYNQNRNTFVVVFHGSRNGSKLPIFHSGQGDWGANFNNNVISLQELFKDQPFASKILPEVQVHEGFSRNYATTHSQISEFINTILTTLSEDAKKNVSIYITGHSKGAAVASIAAPLMKLEFPSAKVYGVVFSAPRAYSGVDSRRWAERTLDLTHGKSFFLRVNVFGDPVTVLPTRTFGNFEGLGGLVLDTATATIERAEKYYGKSYGEWYCPQFISPNAYAAYHYGSNNRLEDKLDFEFDPNLVLPAHELVIGLKTAHEHLTAKGQNHLFNSIIPGDNVENINDANKDEKVD